MPAPASPKASSSTNLIPDSKVDEEAELPRFTPEEEARLLEESNVVRAEGNELFVKSSYAEAIAKYTTALDTCPKYLHYERAVISSNIAACHLKQDKWKEAAKTASEAIKGLDRVKLESTDKVVEIEDDQENSDTAAERTYRAEDVQRLRAKALMRRARASLELGGWNDLTRAQEDYMLLSKMTALPVGDKRLVEKELRLLPPKIEAAKTTETAEMMGKLKDVGLGKLIHRRLLTFGFPSLEMVC
jgi:tetratricopeptide (TPR) repeat protein